MLTNYCEMNKTPCFTMFMKDVISFQRWLHLILSHCQLSINYYSCPGQTTHTFVVRKEENVLFNDALNTFYLQLYDIKHMIKDHYDSKRVNLLLPLHGLLFLISSKGSFYIHHPTDTIAHTMAFATLVVEHWLEQEIVYVRDLAYDKSLLNTGTLQFS